MALHEFVKNAFNSSITTLSGEDVTISGETKRGVIEDTGADMMLGVGAENNERSLRVTFPGSSFSTTPPSGNSATARGKTWKITTVDDSPACITIDLIDPERRN